jgi:hypothetical protein
MTCVAAFPPIGVCWSGGKRGRNCIRGDIGKGERNLFNLFNAYVSYIQTQGAMYASLVNLYKAMDGDWVAEAKRMVQDTVRTISR